MPVTTSIAWPLAQGLIQLIEVQLDETQCYLGWPGDKVVTPEMLWVDRFDSDPVNVPVMQAGRKQRDETVTVVLQIRVMARDTIADTHLRVAEIIATVENAFAADPSLGEFEGVVSAELTAHRQTYTETPSGPAGFGEVTVEIETRLH